MARRNQLASWVAFTAVVPAVVIAAAGLAARERVRARALPETSAPGDRIGPPSGAGTSTDATVTPLVAPPLPAGPAPDLDLVFTDQVIGYIEPCG